MAANVFKFNNVIRLAKLASDPANPENGYMYYNTTTNVVRMFENSVWNTIASGTDLTAHLDGSANQHDATEIDFEDNAASGKNVSAGSAEGAITDLDDAIGDLTFAPSNYGNPANDIVADHLQSIDTALANAGNDEKVKISANDTTAGYLSDKITAADESNTTNVLEVKEVGDAGDEDLKIAFDESKLGHLDGASEAKHTKDQVGLGNVDNTADADKPISNATQTALDLKAPLASPTFTGTVSGVTAAMVGLGSVDNTADADKPISTATQSALDLKAPLASPTFTGTVSGVTAAMVGLGSVDNTADADKPVSTATQSALDLKAPLASPTFTGTVGGITKSMVGLGSVDNTADADKPVSTAQQSALDLKAPLASPTFTGTVSGVTAAMVGLGNVDNTADADKPVSTAAQSALDLKISTSARGAADGVASLDSGGKVPAAQLPSTVMEYKGSWAASTNTPTLADGAGDAGDVYLASDAGTVDFGAGNITFAAGDWVIYNGSIWEKSINSNAVVSVAGKTGTVTLDTDDVSEGSNEYFTVARAKSAAVADAINDGTTDVAPSQNAVFDALAGKMADLSDDASPTLGGDLDTNNNDISVGTGVIVQGSDGVKRGASDANFLEEEYFHAITLTASQTAAVASDLTFAHASFEGAEIVYKIKEATSNKIRIGRFSVVTNGTDVSISDTFNETSDIGVIWDAAINGANVEIKYTTTANDKVMRCDVKRFKA